MKSKSSAKKRFAITGSGKIKRKKAFKRHLLTKKETKQKRNLRVSTTVNKRDEKSVKSMLCL